MNKMSRWMMGVLILIALLLTVLTIWVVRDQIDTKAEQVSEKAETVANTDVSLTRRSESESESESEPEPESESESESEPEAKPPVTLLFAGDVLLSNHVLNAYDQSGGIGGVLDDEIRNEISQSDIFMVNQEFPFSERGAAAADKQYTFRLPPSRGSVLQEMGIDVVTLANNHILDFGTDALSDTVRTLDEVGIPYVGAGENLERAKRLEILEAGGRKIGFLGMSRVYMDGSWAATDSRAGVFSTYDTGQPVEEIKRARERCDYLVVYVHWGIERDTHPQEYQRTMGQQYIDAGADLVVGSHPHVLQGIEYYQGKPIIYSLGNFVFGSSIPKTALLRVELGQEEPVLSLIPCTSSAGYTTMVKDGEKAEHFYKEMSGLSYDVTVGEGGIISAD